MSNSRLQEWQGRALLISAEHDCHSEPMSNALTRATRSMAMLSVAAEVAMASSINMASVGAR